MANKKEMQIRPCERCKRTTNHEVNTLTHSKNKVWECTICYHVTIEKLLDSEVKELIDHGEGEE